MRNCGTGMHVPFDMERMAYVVPAKAEWYVVKAYFGSNPLCPAGTPPEEGILRKRLSANDIPSLEGSAKRGVGSVMAMPYLSAIRL